MFLCVLSFFLLKAVVSRTIVSPWLPTAVPTRDAVSFAMEADMYFRAGNLQKAADAYAAAAVLERSDAPMSVKAMIEAAKSEGLWTPGGGKTPEQTLYSAIIREIRGKGNASRFRKEGRGLFAFAQ